MKFSPLFLGLSMLISVPSFAQDDLVPATSDDIQTFDDSVSNTDTTSTDADADAVADPKKDNFGSAVSAEAKKLKDMPKEDRKKMGEWVSGQRRKDGDKKVPAAGNGSAVGNGSTMGGSSDARSSAPSNNDAGKPTSPGQGSGNGRPSNRGR